MNLLHSILSRLEQATKVFTVDRYGKKKNKKDEERYLKSLKKHNLDGGKPDTTPHTPLRKLLTQTKRKVSKDKLRKEIDRLRKKQKLIIPKDRKIDVDEWTTKVDKQQESGRRGNAIMVSLKKTLGGPDMRLIFGAIIVFDQNPDDIFPKLDAGGYVPFKKMYPAAKSMKNWLIEPSKGIVIALGPSRAINGREATTIYHESFADVLEEGEAEQKKLNVKPIPLLNKDKLSKLLRKELGDAALTTTEKAAGSDSEGTQPYGNDEVAYTVYDALVDFEEGKGKTGWVQILVVRDPYKSGGLLATIIESDI